jgi:hypothetical protein
VGLLWWSAIGIAAVDAGFQWARDRRGDPPAGTKAAARQRHRRLRVQRVALVVTALLAVYAASGTVPDREAKRVTALSAQVREKLAPGTYEVEGKGFVAWLSTSKGLGTDLIAHGYDIRFTEWGGMVDEQQRRAGPGTPQVFVIAREGGAISDVSDDPTVLGSYQDDQVQLIAVYVPGGDYANLCEQVTAYRVGAINLDEIAKDRDPAVRAAAEDLAGRRGLLTALSEGTLEEAALDPALVADVQVLVRAYGDHCAVAPPPKTAG